MLPGWTFKLLADGLAIYPPGGGEVGAIRMKERVRPLASVAAIIESDITQAKQRLEGVRTHSVERFTTAQGEFAAILTIAGSIKSTPHQQVERTIAIVFGDDFYQRYDAIVQDPAQFDMVRMASREFAFRASLGLGELRFRRFNYEPPEGWQPLIRVMTTEWYPPDYPKDFCRITVPAARAGNEITIFDEVVVIYEEPGYHREDAFGPRPITSEHGLHGFVIGHRGVLPDGRPMIYAQVLFRDTRFVYMMRIECEQERYLHYEELFKQMMLSVEPLPGMVATDQHDEFAHWAT